jgi:hypothetical protein
MTPTLRTAVSFGVCALAMCGASRGQTRAEASEGRAPSADADFRVAGIVVNANTGAPLDRVDVTLGVAGSDREDAATTTGEDGSFVFDGLKQGKYSVVASRRGFGTAAYQMHEGGFFTGIVTGPNLDTSHLHFQLTPAAILNGSVSDDAGDPVPSAMVTLFRQLGSSGPNNVVRMRTDTTDDAGAFEFTRLEPGTYFVSVSARPWYAFHPQPRQRFVNGKEEEEELPRSPLDVAYPITFYADATDSNAATPIALKAGDHPQMSLTMHAVQAVQLQIKMPQPEGDPREAQWRGFVFPTISQSVFGIMENAIQTQGGGRTGTDGQMVFEISGLAPGEYTLEFHGQNGQSQGSKQVDLKGDLMFNGLSAAATAGTEVHGTLAMAFGARAPDDLNVTLAPVNGQRRGNGQKIAENGTFTFKDVEPGFYELIVVGGGRQLPVLQIRTAGREIEGGRIQIGSDPITLAATAAEGSATVNGFAKRNGQGKGGAMVALVPRHPGANRYLFRRDQSDSDGSFSLYRIVPGRYTLIAIEDGWELEWVREVVLQKYLAQGMQLDIREDTTKIDLSEPIEVQVR